MEQFDDLFNLSRLVSGHLKDDLTEKEQQELQQWLTMNQENRTKFERLISEAKLKADYAAYGQNNKIAAWARISKESRYRKEKKIYTGSIFRMAAASILLFLSLGIYSLLHKQAAQPIAQNKLHEILPGINQATLTLSNGQKITLKNSLRGKLAQQENATINITSGGEITYTQKTAQQAQVTELAYNTLTTKRKEQFPLILADGTKVWLNSSSSITYPVAFNGKERSVSFTGEAYFEVVHNAAKPFRVSFRGQTVEDIGTEFNINAYDDEPVIKTTLINGSVRVIKGSYKAILKPGEAALTGLQGDIQVKDANIEETIAWKNGYFRFNNENIQSIMRVLSRWYDIDVQYSGNVTTEGFYCKISRFKNISSVLRILEKTKGVHFKIDGRRVTVIK